MTTVAEAHVSAMSNIFAEAGGRPISDEALERMREQAKEVGAALTWVGHAHAVVEPGNSTAYIIAISPLAGAAGQAGGSHAISIVNFGKSVALSIGHSIYLDTVMEHLGLRLGDAYPVAVFLTLVSEAYQAK